MIEAAFGLGEVVVGGQVEPDTYVVAKDGPTLLDAASASKAFEIVRGPDGRDQRIDLDAERGRAPRAHRRGGARRWRRPRASGSRQHYGAPQDIEWAIEGDEIFLVQSRPITTLGPAARHAGAAGDPAAPGPSLVSGLGRRARRRRGSGAHPARPERGPRCSSRARSSSRR